MFHTKTQFPISVQIAMAVIAAPIVGYGMYDFWGPYRWVAEFQLKLVGEYYPSITVLLAGLIVAAPLALLASLFFKRSELNDNRFSQKVIQQYYGLIVLLVGLGFFTVAAIELRLEKDQDILVLSSKSFAKKQLLERWVSVKGQLKYDYISYWEKNYSKSNYIPLVGENWRPGSPVYVLAAASARSEDPKPPFKGMTSRIPSDIRKLWDYPQDAPLSKKAVLLELGDSPTSRRRAAKIKMVVGVIFSVLGTGLFWFTKRRTHV